MKRQRPRPEDYNFGWICALPVELEAATKMLDEEHEHIPQDPNHPNLYTLGRISAHNVVIVCLPAGQIGTNSAATVATQMMSKFPSIHYILMVGIGGGVPSVEADIRLGDVVVSQPHLGRSGVVQYDLGKNTPSGFVRTGFLNAPPGILLSALSSLQADSSACQERLSRKLFEFSIDCSNIGLDLLFESAYQHVEGSNCDSCSNSRLLFRAPRTHQGPVVHSGTIASGNQVIRDGTTRDKLSSELGGVLCFEMEAAGLMNNVPCLVIRGICDYADSHKNKKWQPYAAATAAVFAREVLSIIPEFYETPFDGRQVTALLKLLPTAAESAFNSYSKQHDPLCLPNTRVGVLEEIDAWADDEGAQPIFWLNGMAGTGKSTIARTVARRFSDLGRLAGSFFFSRGGKDVHNAKLLFTTLARQLADLSPLLGRFICEAIASREEIPTLTFSDQWTQLILKPLSKLRETMVQQSLVIVLDALDECEGDDDIRLLVQLLSKTNSTSAVRLRVFVTSRPESVIRYGFRTLPEIAHHDLILDAISRQLVDHDIAVFLEVKLREIREKFEYLPMDWPGAETIESLVQNAGGLFIYAATVCRFILTNKKWPPQRLLNLFVARQTPNLSKGKFRKLPSLSPTAELDMMYLQVLKQSVQGIEDHDDRAELADEFKQVVGAIAILSEPLSPTALGRLLDIDQEIIYIIIEDLRSVINVPNDQNSPIRFLHPSFRDFLIDEKRCNDPLFWVNEEEVHESLARLCLQRLESSTGLKKDICGLKQPGSLAADVDKSIILRRLPSELQYACLYWAQHLKNIDQIFSDGGRVHLFLQHHFLHWIEALSLIGKLENGIHAMDLLESIVDVFSTSQLYSFIHEASRFLLYSKSSIERSPLQVYCSTLIFSPKKSLVRQHFDSEIPQWIKRMPEVEQEWSPLLQTLEGHFGPVYTVLFSPNGQFLASFGFDRNVVIWETKTGSYCGSLENQSDFVHIASFSPDGKSLATGSSDNIIRVWNIRTLQLLFVLTGHTQAVITLAFSPSGLLLASVSSDQTIRLWDTRTWETKVLLTRNTMKQVQLLRFSPNTELMAYSGPDGDIEVVGSRTGDRLHTFLAHTSLVNALAFSQDSLVLCSASDANVKHWDVKTWTCLRSLDIFSQMSGFSPDSKYFAASTPDRKISVIDLATGLRCGVYEGHNMLITAVALSPVHQLLASSDRGGAIKLWDTSVGACLATRGRSLVPVCAISFSPNGGNLVCVFLDGTIRIWDVGTGEVLHTFERDDRLVGYVEVIFSPSGLSFLCGTKNGVEILGLEDRELHNTIPTETTRSCTAVALSADGLRLASVWESNKLEVFEVGTLSLLGTFSGHSHDLTSVAFSPDGYLLALGSEDTIILLDAQSCTLRNILDGTRYRVYCLVFSYDGKILAAATPLEVTLWNLHNLERVRRFEVTNRVASLSFFRDGLYILTDNEVFALKYACHLPVEQANEDSSLQYWRMKRWEAAKLFSVFRFPPEYKGKYAVHTDVIAMGLESGRVTFMGLDLDNVPLDAATLDID